jgi:S-adenosylmethionine synthetase
VSDDFIFTSESVTRGHPDKLCDQVSDAIVDRFLEQDRDSSIVAECAIASGVLFISAHYASQAKLDIPDVARAVIHNVGYSKDVFDADTCTVLTSFMDHTAASYRSLDLAKMSDAEIDRITAKHQVTVFGYACNQTEALLPLPIWLAHRLAKRLDSSAVRTELPYLLPDGKTQVGIEYRNGQPSRIYSITLVASQSDADVVEPAQLRQDLIDLVIEPVLKAERIKTDPKTGIFVNPEGPLIGGGPVAHSGLTGRKTGMDTYGAYARHSGAALSGKDPLRVDRVGAYAARYAAKNVVAAGLAQECEVQLSYSIGIAHPVSVRARTFGSSGHLDEGELAERLTKSIDFRLGGIVRDLGLARLPHEHHRSFYQRLAVYGHMGRTDLDVPWERTDKVEALRC